MSLFEEVAVLDLKFRVVVAAGVITFGVVSMALVALLQSKLGFVAGGVAGVLAAVAVAKWILWRAVSLASATSSSRRFPRPNGGPTSS